MEHQRKHRILVNTTYFKRAKSFQGPVYAVNTTNDEKECPKLYEIAKKMLNGLKVRLPFETNNTLWKFRERIDLNKLRETKLRWNHPWEQGNSKQTMELLRRYDVSAKTIKRRKILISYGHNCCNGSKSRAVETAINYGKMDYAEALDLTAVSKGFQLSHQNILRMRRGAGYWLWKPYIILQALIYKLNDGDLLVYHDSGAYFNKDIGPLLKLCQDRRPNILAFAMNRFKEREFSKRDAFITMGMDDPIVNAKDEEQRMAVVIVTSKNCESIQYFMEFLAYASDSRINTDRKNVLGKPNYKPFVENRHDQTTHSLLSKKWGILALRDPCECPRNQFQRRGSYASGPYKSLYVHDRNRN
ncbi:uncharacterized protein LOC114533045 [Dendronephthya gigantea]|uniref:uncharacterized protein LOC114533045 n=1 Tax=Dendronephthya gigantea TaxID=151771 RepID=UPI00106D5C68|nr:uncharacterized protein LOC114533045 [Dendronephthya gigantea]